MSDADWKRAQTEPLQGESNIHFRGKRRLRDILSRSGYYSVVERWFTVNIIGCEEPIQLRSDVFAITPDRAICAECNGPGGHKTKQASDKDNGKASLIQSQHHIRKEDYFTFSYKHLIGREAWTDKEIAEEMNIDTLDSPNIKWV